MSQHAMTIANQAGASFRADLNSQTAAQVTLSSGATVPSTTYAYMWWADTTADRLKQRNSTNSTWISILILSTGVVVGVPAGAAASGANSDITSLSNPTIINYVESVVAIGAVGAASTISLINGTVQTATLTASTATTFTMPTATAGKSFVLLLKQAAAAGNGTATFTGVKFGSSGAPTITAAAGKMDLLSFISDGTNWYGSAVQGYTP